ncbi:MAG TPA: Rrf2 family transcriptional regulator [Chloroflexota bacterium]|nr:Rrf2 family transcriptional regulator [Chloroflexota bacterium]
MRLTLTKQAEYALRILVWMAGSEARQRSDSRVPTRHKAAEIAAATDVPPVFATRVLALLQRHGLLIARAGQQGGYVLGRRADDVSLLEVIEAIEGPLVTRECVLRDSLCGADGYCLLHDAWSTARDALCAVLARTTLTSTLDQPDGFQKHLAALAAIRARGAPQTEVTGAMRAPAAN